MRNSKPRNGGSSKSRNGELPRRSALKTRRGGKRRQPREVQSPYREGKVDLPEGLQALHNLGRQGMCQWVGKAQELDQEARALELDAPTVPWAGLLRLGEDEEQDLDVWHQWTCVIPRGPCGSSILLACSKELIQQLRSCFSNLTVF